ncbi:MAG TPA: isocitrate lyase/phosphoenolpyruvate mutase family protein [Pyrinomonadaceae bacterium]|nr:isocitrate lyase/phosphoenolpyruvate mutase family protein [Pyrinomonadaceae bacterium]
MPTQAETAAAFAELHRREGTFIIPNPWDVGSACLLAHAGFEALATSSAGYAFSIGKADGQVGRDQTIAHAAEVVAATGLPVSIDLENGFGDAPEDAAETIRLAATSGAVGGSIEDRTRRTEDPIYDRVLAAERIRAAAEVVQSLPFPFMLTARAENYLVGKPDLKDTIERLQMYQEAGANVLYAPGLTTRDEITTLISSVDRPVNVLMGIKGVQLTLADLTAMGVKRISVGSTLARVALGAFLRAAHEMKDEGTFGFIDDAADSRMINSIFASLAKR